MASVGGARFMLRDPAHWVAFGFGSGLSPKAPGTVGTLWGWASFLALDPWLDTAGWAAAIVLALVVGQWACTRTARHLGVADPGAIVWDEIVAFWIVLWVLTPAPLSTQIYAFVLFRLFDAVKIGPMAWADEAFKGFGWRGGWGIMFDDLVAAFCTLLVLSLWRWF